MCATLKFRIGVYAINAEAICRTRILHTFKNINIIFSYSLKFEVGGRDNMIFPVFLLSIWLPKNWLILNCC